MRFVLLDRLVEIQPGRRAVARVSFAPGLALFRDHFPGRPIVPGTLLTEAMAQTAGWLVAAGASFARWPFLVLVDRAKFYRPVRPGQQVELVAVLGAARGNDLELTVTARVDASGDGVAQRVASARLLFRTEEIGEAGGDAALRTWARATFEQLDGPAALRAAPEAGS